jgi:hypothetical protein
MPLRRSLGALATAIGIALFMTASAFAWQDRIEGQPRTFRAGATAGVYFWHDDPAGLRLRTTDPIGIAHEYTGWIETDGQFYNLSPIQLDANDSAGIDGSGQTLYFDFHTGSGIDGIDYEIQGGSGQKVYIQRDGQDISVNRVFLGRNGVHPEFDPMTFCRAENNSCVGNYP